MDDPRSAQMAALADEVRNLRASPLYEFRVANRYKPVIGEGSLDAFIMFIGEAPGEAEAKSGRPFVGASGRLLDELLRGIGLERSSVYITNVVKDRPPENRDPTREEIELYTPILLRQIDIIRPKVIVTLGRFALAFMLDLLGIRPPEAKISKLHGQVLQGVAPYGPVSLVPLFHPAVALYSTPSKATLVKDFQVLKQFL
ncbi:MAG TPA: uracil-DNA glycosylase [Caldilineaceae bacterium]|nr:uracil-DNA glycosylase [Caldilineaceae bacterium]